jgi:hypothetical protein
LAQLVDLLHLDGVHSEFDSTFEVEGAIVDEAALGCWDLGCLQRGQ